MEPIFQTYASSLNEEASGGAKDEWKSLDYWQNIIQII